MEKVQVNLYSHGIETLSKETIKNIVIYCNFIVHGNVMVATYKYQKIQ